MTQDSVIDLLNETIEAAANRKRLTSGFHARELGLLQQIAKLESILEILDGELTGPPWRERGGWVQPPLEETNDGQHNQTEARP